MLVISMYCVWIHVLHGQNIYFFRDILICCSNSFSFLHLIFLIDIFIYFLGLLTLKMNIFLRYTILINISKYRRNRNCIITLRIYRSLIICLCFYLLNVFVNYQLIVIWIVWLFRILHLLFILLLLPVGEIQINHFFLFF